MKSKLAEKVGEAILLKQKLLADDKLLQQLAQLAHDCLASLRHGGKIIFSGNGGSFADAQHISAEFTSRLIFDRAPLASLALGTNSSAMSAVANDYGYEQVFARELQSIATSKDILITISTSGNSPNIVAVVKMANQLNIRTVALTGEDGGLLFQRCECLRIPSRITARIQECHIHFGHILCEAVESEFFRGAAARV